MRVPVLKPLLLGAIVGACGEGAETAPLVAPLGGGPFRDVDPDPGATTMQCAQLGWRAPLTLTESEYVALKLRDDPRDPLTAFAAVGCSFGGKWWGGYARNARGYDFASAASRSITKKALALRGAVICCEDYRERDPRPEDCAYLDPPS